MNAYRTIPLPSVTMAPSDVVAVLSSVTLLADVPAAVLVAVLGALLEELAAAGAAAGDAVDDEHAVTRVRVAAVASAARS